MTDALRHTSERWLSVGLRREVVNATEPETSAESGGLHFTVQSKVPTGVEALMSSSSYTSSSLTLRAILKSAAGRLGMGVAGRQVSGLTAPAKALFAAVTASRGPVLLVVPTDAEVEKQTMDVRFFLSAFEGLSDAEVERSVLPFPSHEVDPYRGLAPHFDIASARARALHALTAGTARVIIASASALLPRVAAPQRIVTSALTVSPGHEISPVDLGDLLAAAGYSRQDPVDESGEFCIRGGVVDFYPAGAERPIRLEFVGDTIESIRAYDPATQRSVGAVDRAAIIPLTELPGDPDAADRSATVLDYLSAAGRPTVLVSEPDEVKVQGSKAYEQVLASYEDALSRGDKAPVPESLVIDWAVVASRLDAGTALESLALGEDAGTHIASQPAVEFGGRLQEWVAEIKRGRDRGETMIFIAHTQGRAERTIELLTDYSVFAVPIERAEDAHSASVLVGVGRLTRGFRLPEAGLQIWAETDVFEEERQLH
jgi:transcription-repair coupling factor (superfamily II helicase)